MFLYLTKKLTFLLPLCMVIGLPYLSYSQPGLKDVYKDYFPIGVAVGTRNLTGDEAALIKKQFNKLQNAIFANV